MLAHRPLAPAWALTAACSFIAGVSSMWERYAAAQAEKTNRNNCGRNHSGAAGASFYCRHLQADPHMPCQRKRTHDQGTAECNRVCMRRVFQHKSTTMCIFLYAPMLRERCCRQSFTRETHRGLVGCWEALTIALLPEPGEPVPQNVCGCLLACVGGLVQLCSAARHMEGLMHADCWAVRLCIGKDVCASMHTGKNARLMQEHEIVLMARRSSYTHELASQIDKAAALLNGLQWAEEIGCKPCTLCVSHSRMPINYTILAPLQAQICSSNKLG